MLTICLCCTQAVCQWRGNVTAAFLDSTLMLNVANHSAAAQQFASDKTHPNVSGNTTGWLSSWLVLQWLQ
jgi:hypothetical protein